MPDTRQHLGQWGESLAAKYLLEKGYDILERNARTPHGEIDLVTRQAGITIFVEVKTRTTTTYGPPETAITPTKQAHLLASAQAYLQNHPELDGDWQIDVIAIRQQKNTAPEIIHFENAVS